MKVGTFMTNESFSILIIDDDKDVADALGVILERQGYRTKIVHNGQDAIDASKKSNYNVALIDIMLPDISGIDLLKRLNEGVPRIRKIIVTGHATLENAVKAVNMGADAYLMKPVSPNVLLRTIKQQLKKQDQEILVLQKKVKMYIDNVIDERIKRIKSGILD
ncbi:MAG TPA: response regulator [Candidatus Methanomethylicus sp.]|nr:response regulator [Candidatus Methanomethylicus sp.]